MHLLLDTPSISISYDYTNSWLYANWKGDQTLESVQWGALEMLRLLRDQRNHKVLNDNRLVTSIWSDASEWGGKIWFPMMADAGLQYFAWVYSPHLYSRLSTDLTLRYTTSPIVATFDSIETAANWLRQM